MFFFNPARKTASRWISVSGCKLTILPDIQPANRSVIISESYSCAVACCGYLTSNQKV